MVAWSEKRTTLQEFETFLKKVFGFLHKHISLRATCNQPVTFVCSTPFFNANAVVKIIKEKEKLLLELNAVSIVVGFSIIFQVRCDFYKKKVVKWSNAAAFIF